MVIKFQKTFDYCFYISIGYKSELFSSSHFITWGTEYYDKEGVIEFATMKYLF